MFERFLDFGMVGYYWVHWEKKWEAKWCRTLEEKKKECKSFKSNVWITLRYFVRLKHLT